MGLDPSQLRGASVWTSLSGGWRAGEGVSPKGRGSESPPYQDSFLPQKILLANATICLQKRGFIF